MNIGDYQYHDYPSSIVRSYKIHTLDDHGVSNEGLTKYCFNDEESYMYKYLPQLKPIRYEQIYPQSMRKGEDDNRENGEAGNNLSHQPKTERNQPWDNEDKSRHLAYCNDHEYQQPDTTRENKRGNNPLCQSGANLESKLRFDKLAQNSIWKPIHTFKNSSSSSAWSNSNIKNCDDYIKQFATWRNSLNGFDKSFCTPKNYTKKQLSMGFSANNVPFISKECSKKNSPFDWYQKKIMKSTRLENIKEDNQTLLNCFGVIDEQAETMPGIERILQTHRIKNVNLKPVGKFMGERYNPHNYENYSFEKK